MKSHQMIEYKANRSFARLPPQILPNNLSICSNTGTSVIGSQNNISSIHLVVNTNNSKIHFSDKSSQSSELSMDLSKDNVVDYLLVGKINGLHSVILDFMKHVSSLENGTNIIDKNIDQMETHLTKIRRYYYKQQLKKQ
ncbi:Hypothetical_protein [Hexamita inflata]|uniref:Hypothetical_protein n=1 Tax=Hexamita inflata TaxID=28002 RepID=A0AA86QYC8_9EUKA|nr:Hypothetical protein HINF_LOCUS54073 [Hexamita inflata]